MGVNHVIQWLFKKGMAVYRLDERFASIDRRFDESQVRTDQRFESIDRNIEDLKVRTEQRFEAIERRLDKMDDRFVQIETRLDRIESKFDAAIEMRERLAVLEALVSRRPA